MATIISLLANVEKRRTEMKKVRENFIVDVQVVKNGLGVWKGVDSASLGRFRVIFDELRRKQNRGNHSQPIYIRVSIKASISVCHADDPGSIPGRGNYASFSLSRIGNKLFDEASTPTMAG